MFALTYTNLSGYEPCDAEFEIIAVSSDKGKLEWYASEMEKPSREYDKVIEKYKEDCNEITKSLFIKHKLEHLLIPPVNRYHDYAIHIVRDKLQSYLSSLKNNPSQNLLDYIKNDYPYNKLLDEFEGFPEEPKMNSYYYVSKGYCDSGLNVIEVTEI